ncbi:hypothetical protein VCHENC02_1468, partial [Vibrio harveyi]
FSKSKKVGTGPFLLLNESTYKTPAYLAPVSRATCCAGFADTVLSLNTAEI